jgi:acyl-CoA hydrolase
VNDRRAPVEVDAATLDLGRFIRAGDIVAVGHNSAEPLTLSEALIAQQPGIGPLTTFIGFLVTSTFDPANAPTMRYESFAAIGTTSKLSRANRLSVVPCHYSQVPELFAAGRLRADVTLMSLSPPGPDGRMSLGTSHEYVIEAALRSRVVIAEVNAQMPFMYGGEIPDSLRIDAIVRTSRQLPQVTGPKFGDEERKIAALVAGMVANGGTIQLGLGSVPDAIAAGLTGHRHLGVHTGMLTESIMPLVDAGIVDNSAKPFDQGVTVSGIYVGTDRFYRALDRNKAYACLPPRHTHAIATVARIPNFVSINTAIEVDLAGQVNSEIADGMYVGGTAGAVDYVRGAQLSAGGRSIMALLATAKKGTVSRIVPKVSAVTVAASDIDTVVTEYGVAELKGVPLEERAKRMIAIAHPAFREELERGARGR